MKSLLVSKNASGMEFSYPIVWENSFCNLLKMIKKVETTFSKICIITDSNAGPLYEEQVSEALSGASGEIYIYRIPAGEQNKNLSEISNIYEFLICKKFDRKGLLIALGGGVVGDMTGFTAATYLRGIDFIQIPTTLLAQVDSSVGGKTGVDFEQYKNMVGAFYQPKLVYMNVKTLSTLPDEQFASGMGEVLKTGLIKSSDFFCWIQKNAKKIIEKDSESLVHMIRECCRIKAQVVEEDPTEQGIRAILNFGHTLGHAIEKYMDFKMLHGQCVAAGFVASSYISYKRELLTENELSDILNMNRFFSLPVSIKHISARDILNISKSDKKMENGNIKFILLDHIGKAFIDRTVSDDEILSALDYLIESNK